MRRGSLLASLVVMGAAIGCVTAPPAVPPPRFERVAEVHRAKCGNCHVRVEPQTRSRAMLEDALTRHRKRVHLSDDEWTELIEYLAPPST